MKNLYPLFEKGIKEMHASEKEIIKALPSLIEAAREPKLKDALRHHLEETKEQVIRLEEIANEMQIDLRAGSPTVMQALLKKGQECITMDCSSEVRDAAIIAAAQCVEHHEMAVYGTLKTFACVLKLDFAEKKLDQNLQEEGKADKKLTEIAEGTLFTKGVNKKAC